MFKWIARIGIVLALCLSSVVVFAQDATPAMPDVSMFCGSLAQEDCDLLVKAADAMKDINSASFDFDVQLTVAEGTDAEDQTLGLSGSGSFTGKPAAMGMEMMHGGGDPAAMFSAMTNALKEFAGDLTLNLTLPPKVLEDASKELKGDLPETISLQLRLVDGVGYINTETLKPILEAAGQKVPPTLKGWIGIDIVDFLNQMIKENPDMLAQMGQMGQMGHMGSDEASAMFADPSAFASAIHIERSENSDGAAVFTITLDFAKLAADPAFADMIKAQAEKQGEKITDEDLQKGLDMIAKAGDAIQFTATEMIDLETNYLRSITLNVAFDGSKFPHESGTSSDSKSSDMENTKVSLTATVNISDVNSAAEITAPEEAMVLPPEFLISMMDRGMSGASGASSGSASPAEATPEATPSS
jgi:hypothetical protein